MLENHHKAIIEEIFNEEIDNFIKKMSSKPFEKNNFIMNNLNKTFKIYSSLARSFDSTLGNTSQIIAQKIAQYMYTGKYKNLQYSGFYKVFRSFDNENNIFFQFHPDKFPFQKREIYPNYCNCSSIPYQKNKFHHLIDISNDFFYYSIVSDVILPEKGADLVINLNNRYYIIEIKLGGNLDNKKLESEYNALKKYQEKNYPNNNNVSLCLGTVYAEEDVKIKLSSHFKSNFSEPNHYLFLEEDFWNFICGNHEDGYSVIKEIYLKNINKINAFLEERLMSIK